MIVRDEARHLPGCLASVAGLVDEIIVVDTGSVDETPALARAAGAIVSSFPWRDDFSAARNASLAAASGVFVLILDADERLEPSAAAVIRALIAQDDPRGPLTIYLPLIRNVDQRGAPLGADHMPRLWRADPRLRFSGRVHERVGVGLNPKQVFASTLQILHLGYDPEWVEARGKRARNLRLIEAERAADPSAPIWWYYLARERYAAGEDAAALEGFCAVIADGRLINFTTSARLFAVECLRALGRDEEALVEARAGLEAAPGYSELAFVGGQAALALGRAAEAEALLRRATRPPEGIACLAFRAPDVPTRAALALGRLLLDQGRAAEALAYLRLSPDGALDAAQACIQLNDARGALDALRGLPKDASPEALEVARALLAALRRHLSS